MSVIYKCDRNIKAVATLYVICVMSNFESSDQDLSAKWALPEPPTVWQPKPSPVCSIYGQGWYLRVTEHDYFSSQGCKRARVLEVQYTKSCCKMYMFQISPELINNLMARLQPAVHLGYWIRLIGESIPKPTEHWFRLSSL
jgi:hypothetical protein